MPAFLGLRSRPRPVAINIVQCCQVAIWLRAIFEHFKLESFPKTSGSKGLQIYVPLNTKTSYDETKPLAHALARLLENEHRDLVVSDMKKAIRTNKVFVDWSQNDEHKTTISVYALRARERPTISTPVTWDEVGLALKKKDASLARSLWNHNSKCFDRVEKIGDLFAPLLSLKQKLPKLHGTRRSSTEAVATEASKWPHRRKPRCERIRVPRRRNRKPGSARHRRSCARRYNSGAETSSGTANGATLRGNFRLGVSELEARLYPGKTGADEIFYLYYAVAS